MKDVFATRRLTEFVSLHQDLCDSLQESLPGDEAIVRWINGARDALDASPSDVIREWHACVSSPLRKQHARYVRAIASITGTDACVYHAIAYKDGDALDASEKSPLGSLSLSTCRTHVTSTDDVALLWQYLNELSTIAYRWVGSAQPSVPTPEAIAEDIEMRRRRSRESTTALAPVPSPASCGLVAGIEDLWLQLTTPRGVTQKLDDAGCEQLRQLLTAETLTSDTVLSAFPELASSGPLTQEEFQLIERMRHLHTMNDAIPSDMMRGIENVANQLVRDINSGRCDLATLDIERIGQQVIQGVSDEDMGTFATNLDKIIPALQQAQRPAR